jgi:hypothetical protein
MLIITTIANAKDNDKEFQNLKKIYIQKSIKITECLEKAKNIKKLADCKYLVKNLKNKMFDRKTNKKIESWDSFSIQNKLLLKGRKK